jgi:hypothetical protein
MRQIFLSPEGVSSQAFQLDGVTLNLRLSFNERTGNFYLDIFSVDDSLIIGGILVENRKSLYSRNKVLTGLNGNMLSLSLDGNEPTFEDLKSGNFSIIYYENSEISEVDQTQDLIIEKV